jgi:hypothetical protein
MKVAFFYHAYRDNLAGLLAAYPGLPQQPLAEQQALVARYNYLFKGYELSFGAQGHEVLTLPVNAGFLLQAWAREHIGGKHALDDIAIAVEWARRFAPDVVFYHPHYAGLLRKLKAALPKVRCWIIPANNPIHDEALPVLADAVFSCIPDMVRALSAQGVRAFYVPHGFPKHILDELPAAPTTPLPQVTFVGSIVREAGFHARREALLLALGRAVPLAIHSPMYAAGRWARVQTLAKQAAYVATRPLRAVPPVRRALGAIPALEKAFNLHAWPRLPQNPALGPYLQPPVFGPDMFATLQAAQVVLNQHIEVSATSASNMRLYEATGMGACLLTDWKENLHELFDTDAEVATYNSVPEAVEKARYLLNNANACRAMGAAAQRRVLRDHLQEHRVTLMLQLLRKLGL